MNITYTSKGHNVAATITPSGSRFTLRVDSGDGRSAAKVEGTVAELIEYLLYAYPEDAPTCVCGTPLAPDGTCSREAELDAGEPATYDGDTEEFMPLWAEPMVDQPSFPHDEGVATFYRQIVSDGVTEQALVNNYAFKFKTGRKLAKAAVRHILSQQS